MVRHQNRTGAWETAARHTSADFVGPGANAPSPGDEEECNRWGQEHIANELKLKLGIRVPPRLGERELAAAAAASMSAFGRRAIFGSGLSGGCAVLT
jgi:hypothetical protein